MTKYLITIDGGTTNTRAFLLNGAGELIAKTGENVGVRNTAIDGHNNKLKEAIKSCLERLLAQEGISYAQVGRIVASGMLSSNVGIAEVPHLTAPVAAEDFAREAVPVELTDICPLPIYIIPGLKNQSSPTLNDYEAMDIMRGEETESIPLIRLYSGKGPLLLVLPGSHNKFISVDSQGRITGCLTTLSGELHNCIFNNTILADAVGDHFVDEKEYDHEMVIMGSNNSINTGLGRACFSARILNQFLISNKNKISNYILGVVCGDDANAIINSTALDIEKGITTIVCGKKPQSTALCDVLQSTGYFGEILSHPAFAIPLAAQGAYIIADLMEMQVL